MTDEYSEEQITWFETHCQACGRLDPSRVRVRCGECFHGWRWGWQLSLADARVYWRTTAGGWRWWDFWRRIRPRRPSKVWVCPCCSHDL